MSRGHRILLDRGLQIQAQVFWQPTGTIDLEQWDRSGFTTLNWQWIPNNPLSAGRPWGRWATSTRDLFNHYRVSMVSFQLLDEQDLNDPGIRADTATWFRIARQAYPNTLLFTNQAGDRVSRANMRAYLRESRPDMLMFDRYPFQQHDWGGKKPQAGSPTELYSMMAEFRALALGGHDGSRGQPIPYGMYLQTFTMDGERWRVPSESEIRLSQFAAWTFGYTFVSAFVYTQDEADSPIRSVFFDGPGDTNPTARFIQIAESNRQSLNLAPALVRLISTGIEVVPGRNSRMLGFANPVPTGVGYWKPGGLPYAISITAANLGRRNGGLPGDVLVGTFKPLHESFDGPVATNEPYFMITNGLSDADFGSTATTQRIRVDFDFASFGITRLLRLNRDTGQVEPVPLEHLRDNRYRLTLDLPGGTGDLFKFDTGARFVGQ